MYIIDTFILYNSASPTTTISGLDISPLRTFLIIDYVYSSVLLTAIYIRYLNNYFKFLLRLMIFLTFLYILYSIIYILCYTIDLISF